MRRILTLAILLPLATPAAAQAPAPVLVPIAPASPGITQTPLAAPSQGAQPRLVPVMPPATAPTASPLAPPAAGQASTQPPPRLPVPDLSDDAPPSAFVTAARAAIAAGRRDEAVEAIERAESRVLVRSVRPSRAWEPSEQSLVAKLAAARAAVANSDRDRALSLLAEVLAVPTLDVPAE